MLKPKTPLEKAAKQVREAYAQPEYRRAAMDKLVEIGTEEAIAALLQRFTFNASGQIADESEKHDLVDQLATLGEPAKAPLMRFIRTEKNIAFPIKALLKILPKDEGIAFLCETLKAYEPLDHRSTQAKATLVMSLSEVCGPEHAPVFVPYLDDHHDDVQFQAVVVLEKLKNPDVKDAIAGVCVGEAHASRVQRRAAQALADLKWPVKERYDAFNPELKRDYLLGKKGHLVPKGSSE